MNRGRVLSVVLSGLIVATASASFGGEPHRGGPLNLTTNGAMVLHVSRDRGDITGGSFFTNQTSGDSFCSIALNGVPAGRGDAFFSVSMLRTDGPCPAPGRFPIVDMLSATPGGFVTTVMTNSGSFIATGGTLTITKSDGRELDGVVDGDFRALESSETIHLQGTFAAVPSR